MNKLTHFQLCPFSRAIRLALAELEMDVDLIEQRPWEIDQTFLKLNPSGELPVLQVEGGPTVCGAYAISEYLNEKVINRTNDAPLAAADNDHPTDADIETLTLPHTNAVLLFPAGVENRAEVRRLVDWFHGRLAREVTREMLHEKYYGRMMFGAKHTPHADMLRMLRRHLRYHLGYIGMLANDRRWLAGNNFSFADITAAAQLSSIDYLGEIPWDEFRFAKEWYARVKSRRAFRALLSDRIPGAHPPAHYANLDF